MQLVVNGESVNLPGVATLASLLEVLHIRGDRVALLVNDDVVPPAARAAFVLHEGDRVEILTFAGGG